ncbi:hypothetical protein H2202_010121 [Exophiala xenobiotica]|nr:hypothetical protein H2202_010121 [Exophiala xenobiotica]
MDEKKDTEAKEAATKEDVGTAGTTENQEKSTAVERDYVQADPGEGGGQNRPPPAVDYEFGMGSGRPADEEDKAIFFGSSGAGAHHYSKFGKLLKRAEHLIHGRRTGRPENKGGNGNGK